MRKSTLDMTKGNVMHAMIAFSIPALLTSILQQVYALTDNIIVGRVLGLEALAAVGVTAPIIQLLASLIFGINNGVMILLSHAFGRQDMSMMRRSFVNSLYLGLLVSAVIAALGTFLPEPILRLIGTPEGPLKDAASYIRINFFTCFCPMLYYLFVCAFRGMGDSTTTLYCMIASVVINIFLDYLFVAVFHWGVPGSAWATALAQFLAMLFAAVLLFRKFPEMRLERNDWRPETAAFASITGLAVPIALQNAFNNVGNIVAQGAVNVFGELVMGAYTAAGRIGAFALIPLETIGSSLALYAGQNYGAGNYARIKEGVRAALILEFIFSTVIGVLLLLFGKNLAALFLEEPPEEMLQVSFDFLLITAVPGIIAGVMYVYQQVLRGIGNARDSMYGGFVQLGVKVAVVAIGAFALLTLPVIWAAWPISFAAGGVFVFVKFRKNDVYRTLSQNGET